MPTLTTAQIAALVSGTLTGSGDMPILGLEQLSTAGPTQISFIRDARYAAQWPQSKAGAVVVTKGIDLACGPNQAVIHVADADLAMVTLLTAFAPPHARPDPGISSQAVVDPSTKPPASVTIGANCTIGRRVTLGENVVLHPNVTVLDDVTIGDDSEIFPGAVVRERCIIGKRALIHSNVIIGSDGFGFRPASGGKGVVKIPHIGNVIIHDDVEIGAGTCIDRAKFSSTIIGMGTKIDNLVQIAHNCIIGRFCLIAGHAGMAGSSTLGDGVILGGRVSIRDHVHVGSGAIVLGLGAVMNDIPAGETWGGMPAQEARRALREHVAIRKLPDVLKQFSKLTKDSAK
jgi:UDP-3-O-[3-hydroxymyristoyl] glucosamine N-acyltransferase